MRKRAEARRLCGRLFKTAFFFQARDSLQLFPAARESVLAALKEVGA
jgi:hypothetical protein